jgi:hypothetical protein
MMAYQATIIGATREFHRLSTRSAMRITSYLPYLLPDQATVTHFHWAVEHAMDVLKAVNMWNFPLQEVLRCLGSTDPRYSLGSTRILSPPPLMLCPRTDVSEETVTDSSSRPLPPRYLMFFISVYILAYGQSLTLYDTEQRVLDS